jgi:hypothetical protein
MKMKIIKIILLMMGSINAIAQTKFSAFPDSPNRLFYLQRSYNTDTLIYEANIINNKNLDATKPVNVYWLRYDEKMHKEDLSVFQNNFTYGVETNPMTKENNAYEIKIKALKSRKINVKINEKGQVIATTIINGQESQLHKIFVQIDSAIGVYPKVKYIEVFGKVLHSGKDAYERFKP